jgi:steroid delta-isomerase-like uncharacterized protein
MSSAELLSRWTEALNRHDASALAELYAPDAVVRDPQFASPLEGRDAIRTDYDDFFRAFPDLHATLRRNVTADDTVAYETAVSGTHQGPLASPAGEIPPTGRRVEFDAAGFVRIDGEGRILEENRYYDLAGLVAMLEATAE